MIHSWNRLPTFVTQISIAFGRRAWGMIVGLAQAQQNALTPQRKEARKSLQVRFRSSSDSVANMNICLELTKPGYANFVIQTPDSQRSRGMGPVTLQACQMLRFFVFGAARSSKSTAALSASGYCCAGPIWASGLVCVGWKWKGKDSGRKRSESWLERRTIKRVDDHMTWIGWNFQTVLPLRKHVLRLGKPRTYIYIFIIQYVCY